jgi:peptidylprolyl isomerase
MNNEKIILIGFISLLGILIIKVVLDYIKTSEPQASVKKSPIPSKVLSSSTPRAGVEVGILKLGNGAPAIAGKTVRVHYTAWLESGLKVDSSHDKGEIFSFVLGRRQVIPGWEAGMLGMLEGEKRKFTISPDQAYGDKGKANVPPNAIIIFEVELIKVI